jgi:hypothetical protein
MLNGLMDSGLKLVVECSYRIDRPEFVVVDRFVEEFGYWLTSEKKQAVEAD